MAIVGFCGLMGSGKSYSVVSQVIIPNLKKGRQIVTNIPLNISAIESNPEFIPNIVQFVIDDKFDPAIFFAEKNIYKGAIYVIDEVQKIWKQGQKATQLSSSETSFLTEARHMVGDNGYTTEIVVITQDFSQTNAYLRNLISQTYRAVKLTNLGFDNRFRLDVYTGVVTGQKPPVSSRINSVIGKYKKEIYQYYQTNTKNSTDFTRGMEEAGTRKTVWQNPLVYLGIPFSIIILVFAIYNVFSFFSPDKKVVNSNFTSDVVSTSSTSSTGSTGFSNSNDVDLNSFDAESFSFRPFNFSNRWRISGEIKFGSYHVVYVTDNEFTYPFPYSNSCSTLPYVGVVCDFFGSKISYSSGIKYVYEEDSNDELTVDEITSPFLER